MMATSMNTYQPRAFLIDCVKRDDISASPHFQVAFGAAKRLALRSPQDVHAKPVEEWINNTVSAGLRPTLVTWSLADPLGRYAESAAPEDRSKFDLIACMGEEHDVLLMILEYPDVEVWNAWASLMTGNESTVTFKVDAIAFDGWIGLTAARFRKFIEEKPSDVRTGIQEDTKALKLGRQDFDVWITNTGFRCVVKRCPVAYFEATKNGGSYTLQSCGVFLCIPHVEGLAERIAGNEKASIQAEAFEKWASVGSPTPPAPTWRWWDVLMDLIRSALAIQLDYARADAGGASAGDEWSDPLELEIRDSMNVPWTVSFGSGRCEDGDPNDPRAEFSVEVFPNSDSAKVVPANLIVNLKSGSMHVPFNPLGRRHYEARSTLKLSDWPVANSNERPFDIEWK